MTQILLALFTRDRNRAPFPNNDRDCEPAQTCSAWCLSFSEHHFFRGCRTSIGAVWRSLTAGCNS
jgi:hypothetical protein